jgi:hypothetical protein
MILRERKKNCRVERAWMRPLTMMLNEFGNGIFFKVK